MIDDPGAELAKSFETLRLTAYDDARPYHVLQPHDAILGTLTIGWGHTGSDVHIGLTWTRDQADAAFDADWQGAKDAVRRLVTVPLTDGQRAALDDFEFNVGSNALAHAPLLALLNAGRYDLVASHLLRYTYDSKGVMVPGLLRRRVAEVKMWHGIAVTPSVPVPAQADTTASLNAAELATL